MKTIVLVVALATISQAVTNEQAYQQWLKFKLDYGKYYRSVLEDRTRFNTFRKNLEIIEEHNKLYANGQVSYKMGVTRFADMTQEEFAQSFPKLPPRPRAGKLFKASSEPAKEVDWRKEGLVTPVKDQGGCGSCYAFSTTGSLEGQYKRKNGKLLSFSEQNLVDCSNEYGNEGCDGGLMTNCFKYIEKYGINTEDDYPYLGYEKFQCAQKNESLLVKISDYVEVPVGEENLKKAVSEIGPISVLIDDSHLYLYDGGIYHDSRCNAQNLNHAVLVVGYGSENGKDYWILKNSWGESFGESGYIRYVRNENDPCGITIQASYPVL